MFVGHSTFDVECSIFDVRPSLDIGCWMFIRCSTLDVRMFDVECSPPALDVGCSMFNVRCSSLLDVGCSNIQCSMFAVLDVGCSMFNVRCSFRTRRWMFDVQCSMFIPHSTLDVRLFDVQRSPVTSTLDVRCSMFNVF